MRVPGTPLCAVKGSFIKIQGFVVLKRITIKALIATTADKTLNYFQLFFRQNKA